ncbi:MAG: type II secretion system protein [Candidatus Riflebacteria bacterium]|nr:type II secretion system protein [Candidatus Riflebacteria bacterium]
MNRPQSKSNRAFTLIETIVVMAISAVFTAGLWGLMAGGNRSFEDSAAVTSATRSAVTAMEYVRKDLARLTVPRDMPPLDHVRQPVRILSAREFEFPTLAIVEPQALGPSLAALPADPEPTSYRFVPPGEKDPGLYRNGKRLDGIVLDRFEVALVPDSSTGAQLLCLSVTGADPSGRKSLFFRDVVCLDGVERLRRHPQSVPNSLPELPPCPDPTVIP